jgi:hypothetical protein
MGGFKVTVDAHGTLFIPGAPEAIMLLYSNSVTGILGDMGVNMIRAYLPTQYMYLGHNGGDPKFNPVPPNAGLYQSGIHTDRQTPYVNLIHDTPVVYGPWLEGVGSRNPIIWPGRLKRGLPGRFPGYHTFRIISQELDMVAEDVANEQLGRYVEELNV